MNRADHQFSIPQCAVNGQTNNATLCPYTSAAPVYNTQSLYQFYSDICSAKASTTVLHYASSNEVDYAVYRGTKQVWRWSSWHTATQTPHPLALQTGSCSTWTFNWTGVDAFGNKVAKGDYTLETTFLPAELAGRRTQVSTFAVK